MPTSKSRFNLPQNADDAETLGHASKDGAYVSDAGKRSSQPAALVAIDPGVNGGLAWSDVDLGANATRMPETDGDILDALRKLRNAGARRIVMELPAKAIFGAGHSSLAVLHRNVGFIQGVAMTLGFELHLLPPQKWLARLSLKKRPGEEQRHWKNRLKEEAQRRFPHLRVTLNTADALLILASQQ
jgi:hypothetical protein